jgi:hypothetical protein
MRGCVAPKMEDARDGYLVDREMRTRNLQVAPQDGVTAAQRAAIVAEYDESFDKLARAQQRPRCAFETGISLTTVLPHTQSARQIVRLLDWRVEARIMRKDIDGAIDDIATGLRLSRDLRPRGFFISQLFSFALDSVIVSTLVPRVLAAPNLTGEHCDRLLDLVTHHATEELDPLAEGFRMEYLMCRDILHHAEQKLDPAVVAALDEPVRAAAETMTDADFAAEVELLNRYFEPMIGRGSRPLRGPFRPQPGQQDALAGMKICRNVLSGIPQVFEACRRDRTRLGATRCLIALRRWQLKSNGANPPDLHVLCKETGMDAIPVDEYSDAGEPLRSTLVAGEFVIYSIAGDGKDDQARADWEFGKQPGDWIFRLPPPP